MRVLLTGGTGYLGRAIVRALVARHHDVVVFARSATRAGLPGCAIDGDVRDDAALTGAAQGCDALIHSAALVSLWQRDRQLFDDVNVGGLLHALGAARAAKMRRLIYTSSFLVLPPAGRTTPIVANDYQRTKVAAHAIARDAQRAGAPLVILYPGVVYGPGVASEGNLLGRLLGDHAAGRLPGLVGRDRTWSFAWVDDVAAAHVAALEHANPDASYALGGEDAPQVRPFEIVRELTGRALPRSIPYWAATTLGHLEQARARLTRASPLITAGSVEIFRHDWPLGHEAAARDLGYQVTPLSRGVAALTNGGAGA
jgi:NAD+-dependent farnesol dehydrogenase